MLAFLQYLLAYVIVTSAAPGPGTVHLAGIVAAILGYAALARLAGIAVGRAAAASGDAGLRRLPFLSNAVRAGALAVFLVIAEPLGGAQLPDALGIASWPLVPRLLQMLPYFLLVAGSAWGFHAAMAALRVGAHTPREAVADEFRDALFPLASLAPLVLVEDLLRLLPPGSAAARVFGIVRVLPATQAFLMLGAVFLLLLVTPFAVRYLTRAQPMPDGPLRRRLEAYSRRVGLRYRRILIWPTEGRVLNATVVGALPRFRYVMLTDALVATLGEEEVEAVFAHEAGHARRGHILLFFGFTSVLGLLNFVPAVGFFVAALPPLARILGSILIWLGVVFGWVSRRFEQEADVYGIETVRRPETDGPAADHPFARAMTRIAEDAGVLREVTGWRHFSVADRIDFIRRYLTDAEVRRSYRTSIRLLRGALIGVIALFLVAAAAQIPRELAYAAARWEEDRAPESTLLAPLNAALAATDPAQRGAQLLQAGVTAAGAGRTEEALRWLREAVALTGGAPVALAAYAGALEQAGRPLGARMAWAAVAADVRVDPNLREFARRRAAALAPR